MYEKLRGNDSFHAPFINYLPKFYDTVEMYSDAELDEFQSAPVKAAAKDRKTRMETELKQQLEWFQVHGRTKAPFFHERISNITFELYHWAWQTVGTRSFGFFDIPGRHKATMVPIADLFNHHEEAGGTWTDTSGRVEVFATQPWAAGQELKIGYGMLR